MNEKDIISSVQKGNHHSFDYLVNLNKDLVFSICLKICEDYHLAEEAAQDTFLKAFYKINTFKGDSKFSSWLYKIAINVSYNKIRRKKPIDLKANSSDFTSENEFNDGLKLLNQIDQKTIIEDALKKLPNFDALIINLYYLEDCNIKELATICDLSVTNTKVKLHRIRKKLKSILLQMNYKR